MREIGKSTVLPVELPVRATKIRPISLVVVISNFFLGVTSEGSGCLSRGVWSWDLWFVLPPCLPQRASDPILHRP